MPTTRPGPPPGLDFDRPFTTVDVAIFGIVDDMLQVLLVQRAPKPPNASAHAAAAEPFPGRWALPGGFVDVHRDRDLQGCALLKLREKTGVRSPYVEQVGSWGSRDRDPRGWSTTHLYFALIADPGPLKAGANAADARWFPVRGDGVAVSLAFDHAALLAAAVERLRGKVEYTSLAAYLLPETFTLSELQHGFEIVLGRALEKSAFRRRVKDAGLVEEAQGMRTGAMRPAQLYRLVRRDAPVFFPRPLERRDD